MKHGGCKNVLFEFFRPLLHCSTGVGVDHFNVAENDKTLSNLLPVPAQGYLFALEAAFLF